MKSGRKYSRRRSEGPKDTITAPSLSSLASLAAMGRVEDDKTVKGLLRAVQHSQDPEIAQEAFEYLHALAMEQVVEPDPFAPAIDTEQARGEIELGVVKNSGCVFGLSRPELCQHTLIVGRSGSGKTTVTKTLIRQVVALQGPSKDLPRIQVFDIKRDYVDLPGLYLNVWLFRLPGEDFRWNPLEPPILDCKRWAAILAGVFANAAGFYGGMSTENLAYKYLLELYRKYNSERGIYPCLLDMRDYLRSLDIYKKIDRRSEEYRWFVRIQNRVESLCEAFGETVNCSRGYPLAEVVSHHVVFDMAELKQDVQSFFTETFLTQIVWHRIERQERGGKLRNLAVFDEAKRLMPRYREEVQQAISNISNILAFGREFGVGFVVGECDPALLANGIKSSCYSRFCFSQTGGRDIVDSVHALGLEPEQAAEIQRLAVGEAIVRLAGRIKRPFVLQVTP